MEFVQPVISGTISGVIGILKSYFEPKNRDSDQEQPKDPEYALTQKIEGVWKGVVRQEIDGVLENINITMNLIALPRIDGEAVIDRNNNDPTKLVLNGWLQPARYLQINFENKDKGILHFGTFIMQLSGTGEALTGKVIGLGHRTEKLISADITLKRMPN